MANSKTNSSAEDNPLLKALPPATDYVNYLVLLEYNLTKDLLPTLHSVLQDTTLTANIGWDLIPLLLPLLPESRQCIHDVARLGNPREVVIKVTEGFQSIANEVAEEGHDDDELQRAWQDSHEGVEIEAKIALQDVGQKRTDAIEKGDESRPVISQQVGANKAEVVVQKTAGQRFKSPSRLLRYTNLVEALSLLHPRIKTKFPSRFLSTSLQAVLPAFSQVAQDPIATEVTLDLIKSLSGPSRPKLPPRMSSSQMQLSTISSASISASDPEGQDEVQGVDEMDLQLRLMQSFLTWVVEGFVSSLPAYEDLPGLAWSCRSYEKMHPEKIIPGKQTYTDMFADEAEELHMRDSILGQCLAIARDLKLKPAELLVVITKEDPLENENEDLPSNAADVPLSRMGSLYLYSARVASSALFDAPSSPSSLTLFPDFAAIVQNSLGAATSGPLGSEAESVIDAVLFLGNFAWANSPDVDEDDDEVFYNVLQRLSLLSANTPSPALRYQAHLLTSAILHLNPSDQVRLAFIKDTLEHCPYENLKASAVGWLKDEILSALAPPSSPTGMRNDERTVFATPVVLDSVGPDLILNPSSIIKEGQQSSHSDAFQIFLHHQSFFLAVLNLLYLVISSAPLCAALHVNAFVKEYDISGYCDRLRAASLLFQGRIASDAGEEPGRDGESGLAELRLLDQTIERVMEAMGKAGIS